MNSMFAVLSLCATLPAASADRDAQYVVSVLREHFSQIRSIRVRCKDRPVASGGLWAEDPLTAKVVYRSDQITRESDYWSEPPKQRQLIIERKAGDTTAGDHRQVFFDGTVFTQLDPTNRSGVQMAGGSQIRPIPSRSPLHAIGYLFSDTFKASLASICEDGSKVSVEHLPPLANSAQWLVHVKGLPATIQPYGWGERARKNVVVRAWISVDPEWQIHKFAIYMPASGRQVDQTAHPGIPSLVLDGYVVNYAFVNTEPRRIRNAADNREVLLPTRILHGNGNFTWETTVANWDLNPVADIAVFKPNVAAGFAMTRPDDAANPQVTTSGGTVGEVLRVREISQQARDALASSDALHSPPAKNWMTLAIIAACATIFVATALVYVWRKRR